MTITITEREMQELIETDFDQLLDDMNNLCHLIDDLNIENDEIIFDN